MTDRPKPKLSTIFLLILGVIGCASLLTILSCGGLIYWGSGKVSDLYAAQVEAGAFLDLLGEGKVDAAYASTAPAFQARVKPGQLRAWLKRYPGLKKPASRSAGGARLNFGPNGPRALIQFSAPDRKTTLSLMLTLVKIDGRWKVESINLP